MTDKNELAAISLQGEINANHRECVRSGNETIHYAYECGRLLTKTKSLIKHGKFGKWVDQYCDFSQATAEGYMRLYRDLNGIPKSDRIQILQDATSVAALRNLICKKPEAPPPPPPPPPEGPPVDADGWLEPEEGEEPEVEPDFDEPLLDEPPPPETSSEPAEEPAPVVAKVGRQAEVWEAQQVLKQWANAVGRWINGNPSGIDAYRVKFPGPQGDHVLTAAKELWNAMDNWRKSLK